MIWVLTLHSTRNNGRGVVILGEMPTVAFDWPTWRVRYRPFDWARD